MDLLEPVADKVVEADGVGHIEDQDYAGRTPVVGLRERPVSLLARCVPYLDFNAVTPHLNVLHLVVHARSAHETLLELAFRETVHEGTFTYAGIPEEQ